MTCDGRDLLVWKSEHIDATPALVAELASFRSQLIDALNSTD